MGKRDDMDPTKNLNGEDASTEISAAVAAGLMAADIGARVKILDFQGYQFPIALGEDGTPKLMADVLDDIRTRADGPHRRAGQTSHDELESFIAYVNRFKHTSQTVLFGRAQDFTVLAVLDYHTPGGAIVGGAGWSKHRARYVSPRSLEWKNWTGNDGKDMPQAVFADWIEQHADDIASADGMPKAAELLEMSRNLQIHVAGQFSRTIDPTTGTGSLVVKEEHAQHSTKIPKAFALKLRVFDGGEWWAVEARVRFRLVGGNAIFSYTLHRREEIEREAFDQVRTVVQEKTGCPLFMGQPENP